MATRMGKEALLEDFLTESLSLLSEIESKLMELEGTPQDSNLLNTIFRNFHTIKGGAGFLNGPELVSLCDLTERLLDKLRNSELALSAELMNTIIAVTAEVREMVRALAQSKPIHAASPQLLADLRALLENEAVAPVVAVNADDPDWGQLYQVLLGDVAMPARTPALVTVAQPAAAQRGRPLPSNRSFVVQRRHSFTGRRMADTESGKALKVNSNRLGQALSLSGQIELAKNRLAHLSSEILQGHIDAATLRALNESVGQLDMLVVNLQAAVTGAAHK